MKTIKTIMMMAVLIGLWGCSSDSDDKDMLKNSMFVQAAAPPTWSVDLTSNDAAPSWIEPEQQRFESSMFLVVKLQPVLADASSDNDLMAVFIGDDCRGLSTFRNVDDMGVYFTMMVRGNATDRDVIFSLKYYSAKLHQIFTLSGKEGFATERTYGFDQDFVPPLLAGSSKYPVQGLLTVTLPANNTVEVSENDMVAAMVGNECRGVGSLGEPFTVFRTNSSEQVNICYYSAKQGGIYTMSKPVMMNDNSNTDITFNF